MPYRYESIKKRRINESGKNHYVNVIYPDIPLSDNDQYVITTVGDRLDLLASDIYNDQTLWWVIASANLLPGDSLYPPIGIQLRIPSNIEGALIKYNQINGIR